MNTLLTPLLAAATVVAFILTMVGADLGSSQTSILNAICAVSVLGAATFIVFIEDRRKV